MNSVSFNSHSVGRFRSGSDDATDDVFVEGEKVVATPAATAPSTSLQDSGSPQLLAPGLVPILSSADNNFGQKSGRTGDTRCPVTNEVDTSKPLAPPRRGGESEAASTPFCDPALQESTIPLPTTASLDVTYEAHCQRSRDGRPFFSVDFAERPDLARKASVASDETNGSAFANLDHGLSVASTPTCAVTDVLSDNGEKDRQIQGVTQVNLGEIADQLLTQDAEEEAAVLADTRRLKAAISLCVFFFVVELCGGIFAGSLALLSDSFHLLTDCVSFAISLMAIRLSRKRCSRDFTFGYQRAEIIGALVSVFLIWGLTAELCVHAVSRIADPQPVDGKTMLVVAACGVFVNLVLAFSLHNHHGMAHAHGHCNGHAPEHGHSHDHGHQEHDHSHDGNTAYYFDHQGRRRRRKSFAHIPLHDFAHGEKSSCDDDTAMESIPLEDDVNPKDHGSSKTSKGKANINVRAATLHVIGDLLSSLGVLVAAVVIMLGGPTQVDPICTIFFSAMVVATTVGIARETISVLMERAPSRVDVPGLIASLRALPGVVNVHGLHVWELTSGKPSFSVHLVVQPPERPPSASSSSSSSSSSPGVPAAQLLNDVRAAAMHHGCVNRFCTVQVEPDKGFRCQELEGWEQEV